MSDPFDACASSVIDAGFLLFGKAATYTPLGGDPVGCTGVFDTRDPDQRMSDGRPPAGDVVIEVRTSEVAQPAQGGAFRLTATGVVYTVANRPKAKDERGLVWQMWASE